MGKLINTTTMTVDGLIDVGEWYVAEGGHDGASLDQFDGVAGMLLGRKTYEGLAGFWPHQTGAWADMLNPLPKFVATRSLRGALDWNATVIEGDAVDGVSPRFDLVRLRCHVAALRAAPLTPAHTRTQKTTLRRRYVTIV
ncbi:MAG TPA: hypothetical protein VE575_16170 [Acidimicrobiales bacterium]|jgi:dihydrofolate reductase|nr:hypothetical protein [Acidimicrobiales bacterium]